MVAFHASDLQVVTATAARWKSNIDTLGHHGTGFLLYLLLDGYFPVLDNIAERTERLEDSIVQGGQPILQGTILHLRRDL